MTVFLLILCMAAALLCFLVASAAARLPALSRRQRIRFVFGLNFLLIAGTAALYWMLAPPALSSLLQ